MEMNQRLIEVYGYDPKNVEIMVQRLEGLTGGFRNAAEKWAASGKEMGAGEYFGYTVERLMKENSMNYPAALTTLSWIAKDGEKAVKAIRKGVK